MAESSEYAAVHWRVKRLRGRASTHPCAVEACAERATSWAWLHIGPSRTDTDPAGRSRTWGTSTDDYAPMCGRHSHWLDHGGTLTHCPAGHERATAGATRNGNCRECAREYTSSEAFKAHRRERYRQSREEPPQEPLAP